MVNGKDHRPWSDQTRFNSGLENLMARTPRASISLEFTAAPAGLDIAVTATLPQISDRADAAVFLAVTENNLSNRVTAGENRGATLRHDHVVRELLGPFGGEAKDRAEGKLVIKRPVPLAQDWKRSDLSLVAFVQSLRTGEIYQSLIVPLCANW